MTKVTFQNRVMALTAVASITFVALVTFASMSHAGQSTIHDDLIQSATGGLDACLGSDSAYSASTYADGLVKLAQNISTINAASEVYSTALGYVTTDILVMAQECLDHSNALGS